MSSVFFAVSDPTRRRILDRLRRDGPLSVTELAEEVPVTRQAVTKHLDVLADAGLVRARRAGRRRLNELEPGPLRTIDDWLAPYAEAWDRRLQRLRDHLGEAGDSANTGDRKSTAEREASCTPETAGKPNRKEESP